MIMINLISFCCLIAVLLAAAHGFVVPTRTSNKILCTPLHAKDANMSDEEREAAMEKALKAMTAFSNKYVQNTNTYYCEDKSVPAVVIKGLAEHKVSLGTPLCPCRFYEDKEKEAKEGYW
jgi:ferredoxin-thioredoxin reductase catalytic chain